VTAVVRALSDPLLRYRIMANVVGVMLLVLVFVAMPIRYLGDSPQFSETISPIHGALYIVLIAMVVLLGRARRWPWQKMLLVALGGTIPFGSFVVERRVSASVRNGTDVTAPEPVAR
jgi:integral membrane protein